MRRVTQLLSLMVATAIATLPLSQTVSLAQKPIELESLESGSVKQAQTSPNIVSDLSDWDTTSIQPLPLPSPSLAQQVDTRQLEAIQLLSQAEQLSSRGELEAAIALWEQALALFRAAGDRHTEAQILGVIGGAYKDLGQYEQAIALHQQALAIAIELNDLTQQARALNNLGVAYRRSGEPQMAIDALQSSLTLARRTEDISRQLNALSNLGNTYRDVEDYQQAINVHEEALSIAQQNNRRESYRITVDLASSYNQAGIAAIENGNYQQAINLLQRSLDLSLNTPHQNPEDFDVFNALNSLGIAYRNLGYYQQALNLFQQSIDIARNNGDQFNESIAIGGLSSTYGDLGNLQLSLELQKQSLSLLQEAVAELSASGDLSDAELIYLRRSEGRALGNLGAVYLGLGDYQQATELYEQRLAIARELNDSRGAIFALNALGDIERSLGYLAVNRFDGGRAGTRHEEALEIARSLNNPLLLAQTLVQHSASLSFFQTSGVSSTRIEYLEEALEIYRANGIRSSEANVLMLLGRAHLSNDQPQRAESRLMEAIQILNDILVNVSGDADKISLFETQLNTFALLQQALADQNDFERSLVVAEQGRARALVTLLSQKASNTAAELSSSPAVDIEAIKQTAQQTNSTLVAYSIIRDVDAYYELNRRFGWHPQSGYSFNSSLYIWVVSPDGNVTFRQQPLTDIDLTALVTDTRDAIGVRGAPASVEVVMTQNPVTLTERRAQAGAKLQQLHELLIEPIADLLPDDPEQTVAFIPQGQLFLVPFPALRDADGRYLIENHTIITAPSIQVLQLTHTLASENRLPALRAERPLIVGDPTMPQVTFFSESGVFESVQLAPLYGARREAEAVAGFLGTTALTDDQATESRVKQQMPQADVIHLATHGLLEYGDPRETGTRDVPGAIALAPGNGEDGLLTSAEILQLNLRASLVVLSACDTGRGRLTGDGVIGLSRAFIAAGVPSVVVSLWAVPDAPTADLMTVFYRQLSQGESKAQALRQAMLVTMQSHPDPRNWAAFTLIGATE